MAVGPVLGCDVTGSVFASEAAILVLGHAGGATLCITAFGGSLASSGRATMTTHACSNNTGFRMVTGRGALMVRVSGEYPLVGVV